MDMFFSGDLQAGITLALKDKKPIVCFVKDDGENSRRWQQDFLEDDEVGAALASSAVLLCIQAESQEAEYLSAFCPISSPPTLIIIHNGQLVLELKAGISKSDFTNAVIATIRPSSSPQTPGPDLDLNSPGTNSSTVDDLFRDRRQRLDAEKKQEHDAERAEQKAKAKARREAIEGTPGSARAKQLSYAQQQRKRQQDERLERERIRRDIENDKAARKEKEERRKANYKAETKIVDSATDLMDQPLPSNAPKPGQISSNRCALQVRLFDGSTIRKLFQPQETLRADVRAWIDEQSDHSDVPYTLKQILTPEPNRTIGISEEGESLQSLSLMPSATLVMVPVSNFTDAYSQGVLSRGVSAGYNIASQGISSIAGALYQVLGFGQPTQQAERPTSQSEIKEPEKSRTEIRVRSLRDQQHEPQDHQFYNGNQLNFEPRRDNDNNAQD